MPQDEMVDSNRSGVIKPLVMIAAAGPPRPQILSLTSKIASSAMVPINGRPVIGWILDNLRKRDLTEVVVLSLKGDQQLEQYVDRAYNRAPFKVTCLPVEESGKPRGLAHSVYEGLKLIETENSPLLLILGHTIFQGGVPEPSDADIVFVHQVSEEMSRWCYVETDKSGYVQKFIDKPVQHPLPALALSGVYYLTDRAALLGCLQDVIHDKNQMIQERYEISPALELYMRTRRIRTVLTEECLDCGSIRGVHRSKRVLIASRSFNQVTVDEHLGVVTKRSQNSSKLYQEFAWCSSLPQELKVLTPRVLDWKAARGDGETELQLEYYGYNLLSEVWVYQNLHEAMWQSIITHLLEIARRFRQYTAQVTAEDFEAIYLTKTNRRLNKIRVGPQKRGQIDWPALFTFNDLRVNNKPIRGYEILEPSIIKRIPRLYNESHGTIIHGDFHFGNILYDVNTRLLKLIDARGNFGMCGIFGDCKYDLAKLRHSISGGYDLIVNDLFDATVDKNTLTLNLFYPPQQEIVARFFDAKLVEEGFKLDDIKLIEGLLFLSMLPLHDESPTRQLAMFIRGMTILNDVFSP